MGEYEPRDSRNVTGTASTPDERWSGDKAEPGHGGEYEPKDSRVVTGALDEEEQDETGEKDPPG